MKKLFCFFSFFVAVMLVSFLPHSLNTEKFSLNFKKELSHKISHDDCFTTSEIALISKTITSKDFHKFASSKLCKNDGDSDNFMRCQIENVGIVFMWDEFIVEPKQRNEQFAKFIYQEKYPSSVYFRIKTPPIKNFVLS